MPGSFVDNGVDDIITASEWHYYYHNYDINHLCVPVSQMTTQNYDIISACVPECRMTTQNYDIISACVPECQMTTQYYDIISACVPECQMTAQNYDIIGACVPECQMTTHNYDIITSCVLECQMHSWLAKCRHRPESCLVCWPLSLQSKFQSWWLLFINVYDITTRSCDIIISCALECFRWTDWQTRVRRRCCCSLIRHITTSRAWDLKKV